MKPNYYIALKCEAYPLDSQQVKSYHWRWHFKDREIKEDGKYKTSHWHSLPNSCQQSKGSVVLQIENVSKLDFGQYLCELRMSYTKLAVQDVRLYEFVRSNVPSPPNVNVTVINCGRRIKLQEKPDWGADSYQVKLTPLNGGSNQTFNVPRSEFSDTTFPVNSNTVYDVTVRAKNSAGFSLGTKKQLKTTADIPEAVNFVSEPDGCYAKLSWKTPSSNSCPIIGYTVHYRKSVSTTIDQKMWQTKSLEQPDITNHRLQLNCGMTYDVTVLAWNERGSSYANMKLVSVRTDKGVPFKPLLKNVVEKQCGEFVIIWRPPFEESGGGPVTDFRVQMRKRDEAWRNCSTFLTDHSCSFKDLLSETEYDFRVQAINQKGASDWTYGSAKTGLIGRPDPPRILNKASERPGKNVTVRWTRTQERNCEITMYSLRYRVVKPTTRDWVEINITDVNSYKLHLQYSKKYNVTMFAWNNLGRSKESEAWEIRTAQYVPYPPILHSVFTGGCSFVNVTWSPPGRDALGGPVLGYLAQIKRGSSGDVWSNCTAYNISQSNSCLFAHLKPNTMYDVRVMAKKQSRIWLAITNFESFNNSIRGTKNAGN